MNGLRSTSGISPNSPVKRVSTMFRYPLTVVGDSCSTSRQYATCSSKYSRTVIPFLRMSPPWVISSVRQASRMCFASVFVRQRTVLLRRSGVPSSWTTETLIRQQPLPRFSTVPAPTFFICSPPLCIVSLIVLFQLGPHDQGETIIPDGQERRLLEPSSRERGEPPSLHGFCSSSQFQLVCYR